MQPVDPNPPGVRHRAVPRTLLVSSLLALACGGPRGVLAQGGEWPTLAGAGVEYISSSGFFQLSLSGQLDLEAFHLGQSWAGLVDHTESELPIADNRVRCLLCHEEFGISGDGGSLATHRLRVFADIFLGDHVYTLVEVRSDRGHTGSEGDVQARVEQAFVRVTGSGGSAGLQVGRFASPFGAYPLRHLTVVDPFLRPPLAYDYRTMMSRTLSPVNSRRLARWKAAPEVLRKAGAPPVWDVPYQWGAMLFGRLGPLDLRLAAMNSAPSSAPDAWDFEWFRLDHPSVVLGSRLKLSADLEVGLSYNRGPWMERLVVENPPDGFAPPTIYDFNQEIISADFTYARGPLMLRGEVMRDQWEAPNLDEKPREHSYNVELQYDLWAGVSAAARFGYIDFRPLGLQPGYGRPDEWDYDVYRYEGSLGYRLARNAGILVSAYRQIQREAEDGDTNLVGARIWWAF